MSKRSVCLLITVVGLIIIIGVATFISISDDKKQEKEEFISKNLIQLVKECIKDEICEEEIITVKFLSDNNYITKDLKEKLDGYSLESYIKVKKYEVVLKN